MDEYVGTHSPTPPSAEWNDGWEAGRREGMDEATGEIIGKLEAVVGKIDDKVKLCRKENKHHTEKGNIDVAKEFLERLYGFNEARDQINTLIKDLRGKGEG